MVRQGTHPVTFVSGSAGAWRVDSIRPIKGEPLAPAARVEVVQSVSPPAVSAVWALRGVAGHERYAKRVEHDALKAVSPPLARPEATRAALIPIRKSADWWALSQDERRTIFEARSRHIADSMAYLPRIARRLYHSRELGEAFDFLTWFEFAPEHEAAFDQLLAMLRSREEWSFVEREVDVRLSR